MRPRSSVSRALRLAGIEVTFLPPRVYLFGRRVHHGLVGALLVASDLHDWRVWVADFARHPQHRERGH